MKINRIDYQSWEQQSNDIMFPQYKDSLNVTILQGDCTVAVKFEHAEARKLGEEICEVLNEAVQRKLKMLRRTMK